MQVPVSDVDKRRTYVEKAGFNADHDHRVTDELRFVQLTPPGSGCSIAFGEGMGEGMEPGTLKAFSSWSTTPTPHGRSSPAAA